MVVVVDEDVERVESEYGRVDVSRNLPANLLEGSNLLMTSRTSSFKKDLLSYSSMYGPKQ